MAKRAQILAVAVALTVGGYGCDDDSPTTPACAPVDLQPQKQTIVLGETAVVTAFGGDRTFYEFQVEPDVPGVERKSKSVHTASVDDMFFWRPTTPNPGPPGEVYGTITVTSCLGDDTPVSDVALVFLRNELAEPLTDAAP